MKTFITLLLGLFIGLVAGSIHERKFQINCAEGRIEPQYSSKCIGSHTASAEPTLTLGSTGNVDPQVNADLKELDRRDHMIADRINEDSQRLAKMQAQINQLHQDDLSTLSFIEELFKQFFGVNIQIELQPDGSPETPAQPETFPQGGGQQL